MPGRGALRLPTPLDIAAWSLALADEVARLPATVAKARTAMGEVGRLPDQLEELTAALNRTTATIETTLPRLEGVVIELHHTVNELSATIGTSLDGLSDHMAGALGERLEHLDTVVSDLGRTLTSLIGSIPGARRALRSNPTLAAQQ